LLSSYSQSWKKDKAQTKIDLFTAKGQKTKQRKKDIKGIVSKDYYQKI